MWFWSINVWKIIKSAVQFFFSSFSWGGFPWLPGCAPWGWALHVHSTLSQEDSPIQLQGIKKSIFLAVSKLSRPNLHWLPPYLVGFCYFFFFFFLLSSFLISFFWLNLLLALILIFFPPIFCPSWPCLCQAMDILFYLWVETLQTH